jgi:hypothetical protein
MKSKKDENHGNWQKISATCHEAGEIFPMKPGLSSAKRLIFSRVWQWRMEWAGGAFFEREMKNALSAMQTTKPKPTLADLGEVTDGSTQSPNQATEPNDTNRPVTPKEELEEKELEKARENQKYVGS